MKTTNKPIIFALCGKSATGKDSLAKWLYSDLQNRGVNVNLIVSDTTRPPRPGEVNGKDYNFLTKRDYFRKSHLESSEFRGWYYGTPADSIKPGVNIGVFNADGIAALASFRRTDTIIPVLMTEKLGIRLRRSYWREKKWRLEFFRRAITDHFDFKRLEKHYLSFYHYLIRLDNIDGVIKKTASVYKWLENNTEIAGQVYEKTSK